METGGCLTSGKDNGTAARSTGGRRLVALRELAAEGPLAPCVGREEELQRMVVVSHRGRPGMGASGRTRR